MVLTPVKSAIQGHPLAVAALLGVLVLLVIILSFTLHKKEKASKAGFGITRVNNLNTGSNNPLWYLGSMDAGNWGPIHRDATAYNVAAYEPRWRGGVGGIREGYASGPMGAVPAPAGACPPGRHAITYQDPQGALMVRCGQNNVGPDMTACRGTWDPAATAEAQALATVGSLQHDSYGERSLMGAVDLAFDATTAAGLSDAQLQNLMHQGGTP
jgi:hypothetical protein